MGKMTEFVDSDVWTDGFCPSWAKKHLGAGINQ